MNISEISKLITEKNYVFQVSIPNTFFNHGKTTVQQALVDFPSIEAYLNRIVETNKAKNLLIRLFTPNGSSYKLRGEHLIFIELTNPVATEETIKTNVATKSTTVATPTLNGLDFPHTKTPHIMDVKEQIDYGVLKVEHKLLKAANEKLEAENKELTKKVDRLHDEKLELVRNQSVLSERAKLDIDKAKFEVQQEGKQGLAGLMGEINENPEIVKMLIGVFKPDHPMFKEGVSGADGNKQIQAPKYHDNPEINTILSDLPNTIKSLDGEKIAKVYVIFQKFMSEPEKIQTVYDLLELPK